MSQLYRSLIFVPGNNPRFLEKAKALGADIACLDLEDSVPADQKDQARGMVRDALEQRRSYLPSVFVRTNSPQSGMMPADLKGVVQKGLDGIVIPKVDSAADVKKVERLLVQLEKAQKADPLHIIPSIESAKGVVNAYSIASSSDRVSALVFGVFDLLSDIGVEYTKNPEGARYARAKVVVDARAAGVPAIDAIWQDLKDSRGFLEDCRAAKRLGYAGKSIIHPDQIQTVHRIFHPNKAEVSWARKVCEAYLESAKEGRGATTVDGKMVDEVHYKQAKAVLDLAGP